MYIKNKKYIRTYLKILKNLIQNVRQNIIKGKTVNENIVDTNNYWQNHMKRPKGPRALKRRKKDRFEWEIGRRK